MGRRAEPEATIGLRPVVPEDLVQGLTWPCGHPTESCLQRLLEAERDASPLTSLMALIVTAVRRKGIRERQKRDPQTPCDELRR